MSFHPSHLQPKLRVIFGARVAMSMEFMVLWDVTLRSVADNWQHFRRTRCISLAVPFLVPSAPNL